MAALAKLKNALFRKSQDAPGKSMSVDLQTIGDNADDAELYFLPGFFSRPHDGETGVIIDVQGLNICIATHNYKLDINFDKGEGNIFSYDADGIILSRVKCDKNGKIVVKNQTEDLKTLINDLINEIKNIVTTGSPTTHTVSTASKALLDTMDSRFNTLLGDS